MRGCVWVWVRGYVGEEGPISFPTCSHLLTKSKSNAGIEISIYKSPMPVILFMLSLLAILALSAKHLITLIPWAVQKVSQNRGGGG